MARRSETWKLETLRSVIWPPPEFAEDAIARKSDVVNPLASMIIPPPDDAIALRSETVYDILPPYLTLELSFVSSNDLLGAIDELNYPRCANTHDKCSNPER